MEDELSPLDALLVEVEEDDEVDICGGGGGGGGAALSTADANSLSLMLPLLPAMELNSASLWLVESPEELSADANCDSLIELPPSLIWLKI